MSAQQSGLQNSTSKKQKMNTPKWQRPDT